MKELQEGEGFLWKKWKTGSNLLEAAYLLLANKLYSDYLDAFDNLRRPWMEPEAESFAENWMKKRVPDSDQAMTRAVWRYFLCLLVERRGNE